MGDPQKNWMIRCDGELEGPFTEFELRKRLMGSVLNKLEIRQGESDWFPATAVWSKFKELARAGIYLSCDGKEEGPYTAAKALQLLRQAEINVVEAKVGSDGQWVSGHDLLDHLERLGRSAVEKTQARKRDTHRSAPRRMVETSDPAKSSDEVYTLGSSGMILPSSSGRTQGMQTAAAPTPAAGAETSLVQTETGTPSGRFGDWTSDSEPGGDETSVSRDEQSAEQMLDYPRLPNQQNPAMYFVPGIVIATSGFVMLAYTLLALISQRPGIAVFTTSVIPPNATVGYAATSVINIVFMVLDTVMTLGAITMAMQKNLTLSRAGAVLATIPCVGLVVMPFGIWACVALFTRRAERDFS